MQFVKKQDLRPQQSEI